MTFQNYDYIKNMEQTDKLFDWISITPIQIIGIVVSCLAIFIGILIIIKLSGLRSFAKMTSHDFAVTIATGSILGATVVNESHRPLLKAYWLLQCS